MKTSLAHHPPPSPSKLKKVNLAHLPIAIPRVSVPVLVTLASSLPMQKLPLLKMNYDRKTQHPSIEHTEKLEHDDGSNLS
jgi:hypothetical protein